MQPIQDRTHRTISAAAAVLALAVAGDDAAAADKLARELETAFEALIAERAFADLPTALREAELQALQITLSIYEAGLAGKDDVLSLAGRAFHDAAVRFSATELATAKAMQSAQRLIKRPEGAAARTIAQRRLAAEEGLLTEIDLALGPRRIPERFLALYLDQRPGGAAWFDAFSLYVAWHVHSDKGLQSGLARTESAALEGLGTTLEQMLERSYLDAKQIALRLEERLAQAEAAAATTVEIANREVDSFLDRITQEVGKRHGLPAPMLAIIGERLRRSPVSIERFEQEIGEQAARAKAMTASLAAAKQGTGEAQAAKLVAEGRLEEAYGAVAKLPSTAASELCKAQAAGLICNWRAAKDHLNRAIELIEPKQRQQALDAALQLARVLGHERQPAALVMAADLYDAVIGAAPKELAADLLAELHAEMIEAVAKLGKSQRQLSLLTSALARIDAWTAERLGRLPPAVRARLCEAKGDALLALAPHGADRAGEARTAYAEGLQPAAAASDLLLVSRLHAKIGQILQQQSQKSKGPEAARLAMEARNALASAQTPRLRARDPIWWAEVKVRGAEAAAAATPQPDTAMLRGALVAVKAAMRIIPATALPQKLVGALQTFAQICVTLERAEPGKAWADQAIAAYEEALAVVDAKRDATLWSELQIKLGAALAADSGINLERAERAMGCYRAALGSIPPRSVLAARVRRLLADLLTSSGKQRMDVARLEEAAVLYRTALRTLTIALGPQQWVQAWTSLAEASNEIARLKHDRKLIDAVIEELTAAKAMVIKDKAPPWIERALAKAITDAQLAARRIAAGESRDAAGPVRKVAMLLRQG